MNLTIQQVQAINRITNYHFSNEKFIEIVTKEPINSLWVIKYDFLNLDDEKWYLVLEASNTVLATSNKILPLRELAESFNKDVEIDYTNYPYAGKESFY